MATGKDITFNNNGERFEISLADNGELEFRANDARNRKMVIRDGVDEVAFDGRITVEDEVVVGSRITVDSEVVAGGSGVDGSVQLKSADGANTLYLGADDFDVSVLVGGTGRDGRIKVFDDDARPTIDLRGDEAIVTVGAAGKDGDVTIMDRDGQTAIEMDGQASRLELFHNSDSTIKLDGVLGYVTVGGNSGPGTSEAGTIDLLDGNGTVRIRLSGADGSIELRDSSGVVTLTLP